MMYPRTSHRAPWLGASHNFELRFAKSRILLLSAALLTLTTTVSAQTTAFTLAPGGSYKVGSYPNSVVVADFNGDGYQDFAVVNSYMPNGAANNIAGSVSVYLGSSSGGFTQAPGSPFPAGWNPNSAAVGDFDGDGYPDLAVTDFASNNVTVLLGSKTGAFKPAPGSPFQVGTHPTSIVVGDFNGDGWPDLAVLNQASINIPGVTVLMGYGAGGFAPAPTGPATSISNPQAIAVGDFNRDGRSDLAVAGSACDATLHCASVVTVLLGNISNGFNATFSNGTPFSVHGNPLSLVVGDFNGDGNLDLAVGEQFPNAVEVFLGPSVGSAGVTFPLGPQPDSLAVGDFNGDGVQDLAVVSNIGNTVTVFQGSGPFAFALTTPWGNPFVAETAPAPALHSIAVGDLNGDGRPDLAVVNFNGNDVTVLLNNYPAITAKPSSLTLYAEVEVDAVVPPVAVGIPVTVSSSTPGSTYTGVASSQSPLANSVSGAWIYPNSNPTGGVTVVTVSPGTAYSGLTFSETARFLAPNFFGAKTQVRLNYAQPTGTLRSAAGSPIGVGGLGPQFGTVADFDGDGYPDLVVANSTSNNLTVLRGSGTGGFSPFPGHAPYQTGAAPFSVAVADFNGDGNLDLATANYGGFNVTVLLGDGKGGFNEAPRSPFPVGAGPFSIAVGDFNGDGKPDLAVANNLSNNVTVLLGNGTGGFSPAPGSPFPTLVTGTYFPASIVVGDFDGDGKQDLAIAVSNTSGANAIAVLRGNGSGQFSPFPGSPYQVGSGYLSSDSIVVADFDGDGILDLAVANQADGSVTVLRGNGTGGFARFPLSPFAAGAGPVAIAVSDFNGDGFPDIAATSSGSLVVLFGNGAGGFSTVANGADPVGGNAPFLVVGDFNQDGMPDVAVADWNGNTVWVLLGALAKTSSVLSTTAGPSVNAGQPVPLTVKVSDSGPAFGAPTGSVAFYSDYGTNAQHALGYASQASSPFTFSATTLGAGTHTLTAAFSTPDNNAPAGAIGDFRSAPSTSNAITIQVTPPTLISQTITFGPLSSVALGVSPFTITATASSGLPVSFVSNTPGVCTVTLLPPTGPPPYPWQVKILAAGTCSITASQGGGSVNSVTGAPIPPTAAAPPVTQTFTVTQPAPVSSVNVTHVGNGGSFDQSFSPGMLMSVFGTGLSSGTPQSVGPAPLPLKSSSGTSVTINGIAAPLMYISATQINLQIPYEVPVGKAILIVSSGGQTGSIGFTIQAAAPGIFVDSLNQHIVPNESAAAGSTIGFFLTGVGLVAPTEATGNVPAAGVVPVPKLPVTMTVGGVLATTVYVAIPSWSIGTLQINFVVPLTVATGVQPVVVTVGGVSSQAALLTVTALPTITSFTATPSTVQFIQPSTLSWTVSNATSLSIDNGIGAVTGTSRTINPGSTTTYKLTASNASGTATAATTVTVISPLPTITSFTAAPATIQPGQSSTLSWTASNATSLSIDNGIGTVTGTSLSVSPTSTTTYKLTANNPAGPAFATATVTVTGGGTQTPTITSFTAKPATIQPGQSSTLSWNVANATSISIDNGIGTVSATGTLAVSPAATTTYKLTTTGSGGTNTQTATVTVSAPPAPAISITSLSSASPTALTPLYVSTTGLNATAPVTAQFSGAGGYLVSETAIRVAADGTVVLGVPLYINPATGQTGTAPVTMTISQNGKNAPPQTITIQDLPSVASYGVNPGDISRAYINYASMVTARRINEFQAVQSAPGNTVDTSLARSTLHSLLLAQIASRSDVDRVAANQNLVIPGGQTSDGGTVQFDKNSLDMMDRIFGLYLSEPGSVPTPAASPALAGGSALVMSPFRWQHPAAGNGVLSGSELPQPAAGTDPTLFEIILTAIQSAGNMTNGLTAIGTVGADDPTFVDKILALPNGLGAALGFLNVLLKSKTLSDYNSILGAMIASAGLLENLRNEMVDAAFLMRNCNDVTANTDATNRDCVKKANDIQTNANQALVSTLTAELNLLNLAVPAEMLTADKVTNLAVQSFNLLANIEGCQLDQNCQHAMGEATVLVAKELQSWFNSPPQFGEAEGTAAPDGSLGPQNPLTGVDISGGDAFDTVADPNGQFDMILPLNDPKFTYPTLTIELLDPETGAVLLSEKVDLSGLPANGTVIIPPAGGFVYTGTYSSTSTNSNELPGCIPSPYLVQIVDSGQAQLVASTPLEGSGAFSGNLTVASGTTTVTSPALTCTDTNNVTTSVPGSSQTFPGSNWSGNITGTSDGSFLSLSQASQTLLCENGSSTCGASGTVRVDLSSTVSVQITFTSSATAPIEITTTGTLNLTKR